MRAIMAAQARGHERDRRSDSACVQGHVDALRNRISTLHLRQRFIEADARRGARSGSVRTGCKLETWLASLEDRFDNFEEHLSQVVQQLEETRASQPLDDSAVWGRRVDEMQDQFESLGEFVNGVDKRTLDLQNEFGSFALSLRQDIGDSKLGEQTIQDVQNQVTDLAQKVAKVEFMSDGLSTKVEGFSLCQLNDSMACLKDDQRLTGQLTQQLQKQCEALAATVSSIEKNVATLSLPLQQMAKHDELKQDIQTEGCGNFVREPVDAAPQPVAPSAGTKKRGKAWKKQVEEAKIEHLPIEPAVGSSAPLPNLEVEESDAGYRFLPRPMPSPNSGFSVVSLNILAGYLGRPKTHSYCWPESNLVWEDRKQKLLDGFRRCKADILLLQEVQGTGRPGKDDHVQHLSKVLKESGYALGSYIRVCGEDGQEEGHAESKNAKKPHLGNAVFILEDTWEQLDLGYISFAKLLSEQCQGNDTQRERYAEGKQVAAWARLQHKATQQILVAVSVHVSNNFQNPDKQLAQVNAMLQHLRENVLKEGDALLIGGDFNSMPSSGVYQLMSTGVLDAQHSDASVQDVPPLCGPEGFVTGLDLGSAYSALHGCEPEFTTKAPDFAGTIDYLWYSKGTLLPEQGTALCMPTPEEGGAEGGGIPNSQIPSDHVPLGVAFVFSQAATHE